MVLPPFAPVFVTRLDAPSKLESYRDANGALRCKARIARSGLQTYILNDGTRSVELRPESEVFDPAALASFEATPLTLEHPDEGAVTSANYRTLARGSVANVVRDAVDTEWVSASLLAQDSEAISAIEAGKVQLSCGYHAMRTPHNPPIPYTDSHGNTHLINATISAIRGNHVALCDSARAGPGARLLLDSTTNVGVEEYMEPKVSAVVAPVVQVATQPKPEVKVDAVVVEVKPEVKVEVAQPVVKSDAEVLVDSLKADLAKVTVDRERIAALLVDALSPKAIDAAVTERIAALALASKLGIKTDSLGTSEIRRAVLAKSVPGLKLDSFSDAQVCELVLNLPKAQTVPEVTTHVVVVSTPSPVEAARNERMQRLGF